MKPIRFLAASLAALSLSSLSLTAQTRVQILHASDLEGGVDAIADAPNFAAVVEALEKDASSRSLPSLLLSSGDNYIPGPFFSAAGDFSLRATLRTVLNNPAAREGDGRADVAIMNVLGFDAAAIGNHEFDNGPDTFGGLIGTDIRNGTEARWLGAQFPYLSSNLDFSGEVALSGLFTSSILPTTDFESKLADLNAAANAPKLASAAIVVRGTERFGIVGATTPLVGTISSTGGVTVKNPGAGSNDMTALASIIQPSIDALRNLGVNKIILVTHLQQFSLEQALTPLLKGVDIVIAGGSDTRLADSTDRLRTGDTAQGPYPTVTTNADNEPALILSTDGQYSYVGRLVVSFDSNGVIQPNSVAAAESGAYATDDQGVIATYGSLAAAFAAGTKGADVKNLTDAVSGVVSARDGNVVGKASVFLEGRRTPVRTEETNFGNLTAQANLFVAQSFDKTVLVSHKNGGGIRNPIGSIDGATGELGPNEANPISGKQAGEISQLDIENTLRFNNGLTLITLSREQFKEVLEHAVAASGAGSTPGQFGQFAGVSFSFDPSRPAGSRVSYASLTSKAAKNPLIVVDGEVQGGGNIRIVSLNFLIDGGDSYPFPAFITANPTLANRVDLTSAGLPAGKATFAPAGSEQDALAEYMLEKYSKVPYGIADTAVGDDQHQQQVGTRPGLSVSEKRFFFLRRLRFDLIGAQEDGLALLFFGLQGGETALKFGGMGSLNLGIQQFMFVPMGRVNSRGKESLSLLGPRVRSNFVAQALVLQSLSSAGVAGATSQTVAF